MILDNRYFLGSIGWLPEKVAYGVSMSILPQNDRKRAFAELIISWAFFDFVYPLHGVIIALTQVLSLLAFLAFSASSTANSWVIKSS